jgi:hypothetical protein
MKPGQLQVGFVLGAECDPAKVRFGSWLCGNARADDGSRTFVLKLAKDARIVRGRLQSRSAWLKASSPVVAVGFRGAERFVNPLRKA